MNALIIIPIMFTIVLTQVNRGYINCKTNRCPIEHICSKCKKTEKKLDGPAGVTHSSSTKGANGAFEFLEGKKK